MSKHLTTWTANDAGEIEKVVTYDGVVVEEAAPENNSGGFVFGSWWRQPEPVNDNGRVYNADTGNWEYTAAANGAANPFHSNYEAPCDYQGPVTVWDGYNGE